jgi:hypothetical protein
VPVAVAMAGGYARDTADTVRIHAETLRIAVAQERAARGVRPARAAR